MCKWKGVCVCEGGGTESCRVTDVEIAWSQKCSDTRIIVQERLRDVEETQTSDAEASMLRTKTSMCVFTRKYCSLILKVQFREEDRIKQGTN